MAAANLDDVRLFVSIARAGGLNAAEAATSLARSALSRRLARLEKHLGTQLAKRTPHSFSLTPAGQAYFDTCAVALDSIARAEGDVIVRQTSLSGLVRITAAAPFTHAFLAMELPDFLAEHPEITVEIDVEGHKVDLATEAYDIAIRVGDPKGDGQVARQLFEAREGVYIAPKLLAGITVERPEDLPQFPAIACGSDLAGPLRIKWRLTKGAGDIDVSLRVCVSLDDGIVARILAERGAGIVSMPPFLAAPAVEAGTLVHLLPEWTSPPIVVRAVLPQKPTAATTALLRFLVDRVKCLSI